MPPGASGSSFGGSHEMMPGITLKREVVRSRGFESWWVLCKSRLGVVTLKTVDPFDLVVVERNCAVGGWGFGKCG